MPEQANLEQLGKQILSKLDNLEGQVRDVKKHESQNGGWVKVNETLSTLVEKVNDLDNKISDPESGIIARLRELEQWKASSSVIIEENKTQNDRLVSIETNMALQEQRMALQQKFLLGVALTAASLLAKALFGLVIG
tara:strand:+ start:1536 stop:1946 length:411 start_codon:yes stop_codon:yes gene_type:complete